MLPTTMSRLIDGDQFYTEDDASTLHTAMSVSASVPDVEDEDKDGDGPHTVVTILTDAGTVTGLGCTRAFTDHPLGRDGKPNACEHQTVADMELAPRLKDGTPLVD